MVILVLRPSSKTKSYLKKFLLLGFIRTSSELPYVMFLYFTKPSSAVPSRKVQICKVQEGFNLLEFAPNMRYDG